MFCRFKIPEYMIGTHFSLFGGHGLLQFPELQIRKNTRYLLDPKYLKWKKELLIKKN